MDYGLRGQVAAITGGSEGIGLATALALCAEGAQVAICGRRAEALELASLAIRKADKGNRVFAMPVDLMSAGEPERFIEETVKHFGRIDILVNNAGREALGLFETTDDEAWQADIDLKLFAAIRAVRAAIPHMRKVGGGRIINMTHVGAKQPRARSMPTSVTRAAGIALTKALSKELAPDRILVNTVCVGIIQSGQWKRRREAANPPISVEEQERQIVADRGIPLGRIGTSEEVASIITYLASKPAAYITGAAINVDGGLCSVT